eukprot:6174828-Amphidinium_carterae.1
MRRTLRIEPQVCQSARTSTEFGKAAERWVSCKLATCLHCSKHDAFACHELWPWVSQVGVFERDPRLCVSTNHQEGSKQKRCETVFEKDI